MSPAVRPAATLSARGQVGLGLIALVLFATHALRFEARVTDLSALRVLAGAVPYRDFWTMYAPGSIYAMAAAFWCFGEELVVGNVLGVLTAAAGVVAVGRVAARVMDQRTAWLAALLFAASYYQSGYHDGFGSYPPAILGLFMGVDALCSDGIRGATVRAGLWFGLATVCKHDVGGYACIASAVALLLTGQWRRVPALAAVVLLVVLPPLVLLLAAGAGPAMLQDLVVFPLTDFRWAREEHFPPLVPPIDLGKAMVWQIRALDDWAICNLPLLVAVAALPFLWRARRDQSLVQRTVVLFCLAAFPLFWLAAHVQINTHKVTLTGLAALLAGSVAPRSAWVLLAAALWMLVQFVEPVYWLAKGWNTPSVAVDLPRLRGIRVDPKDRDWMRGLAQALEQAAPPEAPVLVLGNRNDVLLYCEGRPYWLSPRRMLTRHHELHPAVTDTEPVQRQMLQDLARGPLPVLVKEHRFLFDTLDRMKARFQEHLPVGATLLDEWVARHYRDGKRFGMYEVMERK
jgi:hypothetical protein